MEKDNNKLVEGYFRFIFSICYNAVYIWIAVNLFMLAFKISIHLTIFQAISIMLMQVAISIILGKAGKIE